LLPHRGRDQSVAPPTARSTCGSKPANGADNEREWRAQQQHERAEYKEALAHAERSAIPPISGGIVIEVSRWPVWRRPKLRLADDGRLPALAPTRRAAGSPLPVSWRMTRNNSRSANMPPKAVSLLSAGSTTRCR
jgi:hypothetical protein